RDARGESAGVSSVNERDRDILREGKNDLALVLDKRRLQEGVLHEQARPENNPLQPALFHALLAPVVPAAGDRFRIWAHYRPTSGNLDEKLHACGFRRFEDIDLLLIGLRIVTCYHGDCINYREGLLGGR